MAGRKRQPQRQGLGRTGQGLRQQDYWYEYKLTVIDRFGNPDANYPALPGIKSKKQFKAGAVVAVALPYGDLTPAIIGEVEL